MNLLMRCLLVLIILVFIAGCDKTVQVAERRDNLMKELKYKTAKKAPAQFDAWSFRRIAPFIEDDAEVVFVVYQPDGQECYRSAYKPRYPGGNVQSDFRLGFPDSIFDSKIFQDEHIRVKLHVTKGELKYPVFAKFRPPFFAFYKKGKDGEINWIEPFEAIAAVEDN